ncbi:MAG: CoA pyrophosphatase [Marinomonas sp.]
MSALHTSLKRALEDGHGRSVTDLRDDGDLRGDDSKQTASAAVLIAVTERPRPGVLLTQRPQSMRSHPGQVAFPGGKLDPGEDAVTAALREADEELALPRNQVRVIGTTDQYVTGTGFDITPVLATVPADLPLTPNPHEVEAWFEVPLDMLMTRASWTENSAYYRGADRRYLEMDYEGFRIWGVTAGIIANLAQRIAPEDVNHG